MMISLLAALLAAAQPAPEAPPPLPLPGWMAGCWMAEGRTSRTEECWTVPRGAMMLASSHSFAAHHSFAFEHMRIVQENGTLVYIAQPGGASPTRFPMLGVVAATAADGITFQNSAHDYPQRIHYRIVEGALVAEISMADGSHPQRWTFRRPSSGS